MKNTQLLLCPKKVKNNSVTDYCILGMGAFEYYYLNENVNKTLLNQNKKLKEKWNTPSMMSIIFNQIKK